jgi:hypothetical protein
MHLGFLLACETALEKYRRNLMVASINVYEQYAFKGTTNPTYPHAMRHELQRYFAECA